jgi:hypothetical protein
MRADTAGTVYSTHGPLRSSGASSIKSHGQPGPAHGTKSADACGNGQIRCFNSFLYAIDTVVPLISLDQRSTWYPDAQAPCGAFMQWWLNTATVLGWLLSSVFVLSLASLARTL